MPFIILIAVSRINARGVTLQLVARFGRWILSSAATLAYRNEGLGPVQCEKENMDLLGSPGPVFTGNIPR